MNANRDGERRIGLGLYLFAAASFVPLVGFPIGLVSIVLGWLRRSCGGYRIVAIGASGIALSVIIYGSLFLAQRGGYFDDVTAELAKSLLDDSVRSIEFFKMKQGEYPESLEALRSENSFINDPFSEAQETFKYALHNGGKSYEIFSVGPDRVPSTQDDIYPSPEVVQSTGFQRH